jgi:aldose 1-epimerase
MIELRSGSLRAVVLPAAGGGLARLDWRGMACLRPAPGGVAQPLPGQLACFPLVPWSNRIAPDGFEFAGRRITPAPTREGEPCPIHGDGWRLPWQIESCSESSAVLTLDRCDGAPFAFTSSLEYALAGSVLRITLRVANRGECALPFGLGLHPWMPCPEDALLHAEADGVWLSGADKLPAKRAALPPAWNFCGGAPRPLPRDGVDNAFTGWDGRARIDWPARKLRLGIEADMSYFILYAPPGKDFFCFEPVDHPINAHNLPGGVSANGLSVLAPGQALSRTVAFTAGDL